MFKHTDEPFLVTPRRSVTENRFFRLLLPFVLRRAIPSGMIRSSAVWRQISCVRDRARDQPQLDWQPGHEQVKGGGAGMVFAVR